MTDQVKTQPNRSAIELLRVSTDKQDVARQRDELQQFSEEMGLSRVRTLELVGLSGTATLDDAQVQQVLADLKRDDVDGIVVSALDRLFRPGKRYGQFSILDVFVDTKKVIWSVREGLIDPSSDEGYDKCLSAGGRAGAEWRELKRRTSNGIVKTLKRGQLTNVTPRFGYRYISKHMTMVDGERFHSNGKRFEIVEKNAAWVRQAFQWARERVAPYQIARRLVEHGVVSQGYNGKPGRVAWSRQVVLQMLRSRVYIGEHTCRGITIQNPALIPPIVDRELFDSVQEVLKESAQRHQGRPPAKNRYLLRGILWCHRCGRRVISNPGSGGSGKPNPNYRCGNIAYHPYHRLCPAGQVSTETIERAAWAAIWRILTEPEYLLALGNAYYDAIGRPGLDKVKELEAEQTRIETRRETIRQMMRDGAEDYQTGLAGIRAINDRLKELAHELRAAGKVIAFPSAEVLKTSLVDIIENEPTDYASRREILDGILDLHMVYDDQTHTLTVEGKIPVPDAAASAEPSNRNSSFSSPSGSYTPIPFVLKVRVA